MFWLTMARVFVDSFVGTIVGQSDYQPKKNVKKMKKKP
jgi:hypothetical protein